MTSWNCEPPEPAPYCAQCHRDCTRQDPCPCCHHRAFHQPHRLPEDVVAGYEQRIPGARRLAHTDARAHYGRSLLIHLLALMDAAMTDENVPARTRHRVMNTVAYGSVVPPDVIDRELEREQVVWDLAKQKAAVSIDEFITLLDPTPAAEDPPSAASLEAEQLEAVTAWKQSTARDPLASHISPEQRASTMQEIVAWWKRREGEGPWCWKCAKTAALCRVSAGALEAYYCGECRAPGVYVSVAMAKDGSWREAVGIPGEVAASG